MGSIIPLSSFLFHFVSSCTSSFAHFHLLTGFISRFHISYYGNSAYGLWDLLESQMGLQQLAISTMACTSIFKNSLVIETQEHQLSMGLSSEMNCLKVRVKPLTISWDPSLQHTVYWTDGQSVHGNYPPNLKVSIFNGLLPKLEIAGNQIENKCCKITRIIPSYLPTSSLAEPSCSSTSWDSPPCSLCLQYTIDLDFCQ